MHAGRPGDWALLLRACMRSRRRSLEESAGAPRMRGCVGACPCCVNGAGLRRACMRACMHAWCAWARRDQAGARAWDTKHAHVVRFAYHVVRVRTSRDLDLFSATRREALNEEQQQQQRCAAKAPVGFFCSGRAARGEADHHHEARHGARRVSAPAPPRHPALCGCVCGLAIAEPCEPRPPLQARRAATTRPLPRTTGSPASTRP